MLGLSKSQGTWITLAAVAVSFFVSWLLHYEKSPVVRTSHGDIQGFVSTSRSGRRYYQFLGIPYAQPPIGDLRFKSPVRVKSWNGTLEATSYGAECLGFDLFLLARPQMGSESCLFLNVMTPNELGGSVRKRLPVIVYIHGGAFQMGSGKLFPGKYFMDEDVVLVTINYRLGIFGFLTTGDDVIKGNMGLKDQVMALKWIQENIQQFGGDPNQVTVMGESAGGASVHLLMMSPMAKGLFHRAISSSCEGISDIWQFNRNNSEHLEEVARHFHCPSRNTELFAECIRGIDAKELVAYQGGQSTPKLYHNFATFGPTVENAQGPDIYLSENPLTLMQTGQIVNKVPWLLGVNNNEGLILVAKFLQFPETHRMLKDNKLWEKLIPHLIFYNSSLRPDVAMRIREHYFGNKTYDIHDPHVISTLDSLVSHKIFFKPLTESALLQSKHAPVYLYKYNHQGFLTFFNFVRWGRPKSWLPGEINIAFNGGIDTLQQILFWWKHHHYGASHGDETFLLFDAPIFSEIFTSFFDLEMSKLLVKTMADFANARKPVKFNNLLWPSVNVGETLKVMELQLGEPRFSNDPFEHGLKFWKELNLPRE